ncbi:MAG TPA: type II 3-dehydroquinate dehydratase, partial [Bacillota bacterium]|nr:type II 3-dehydroquinate dehydratase [Bacillota bacterium]
MVSDMRIWVINGPNINLLGTREPELYGSKTYEELLEYLDAAARRLGIEVSCFQSNHEGTLIDWVQESKDKADAIIINAGGYTHTSIALMDAVKAVGKPMVEVHLTDPFQREAFRRTSYLSLVADKVIANKGFDGYIE